MLKPKASLQDPIIHLQSRNTSFRLTYNELKELGIKNNKFFLMLCDRSLAVIDPFSKNLTNTQKTRILIEIKKNPWYFYREVCRIKVAGSVRGIPFSLHRANLAQLWCLHNNISCIEVLPRQNFKTISACSFYEWLFLFGTESSEFLIMNKKLDDAKLNLKRIKDMIDLLPPWMVVRDKDDVNNIMMFYNATTKNTLKVIATGKDAEHADGLGRGMTSPIHWFDENAFEKFNKIKYMAAAPSYSQAKLDAMANGKYYSRLITTTPNNIDVPEGAFTKSIINNAATFTEKLYDYSKKEIDDYIYKNSKNDYLYVHFNYKQLRRDQKWFEEQCRLLEGDIKSIRREILCEWTASSDLSPFTEEEIEELEYFQSQPIEEIPIFHQQFILKIWEKLIYDKDYFITVDVAGGLGNDSTVFVINDPDTLDTVGLVKSNRMDLEDCKEVAKILLKMMPMSFIAIERNSYGLALVQNLVHDPIFKARVFYTENKKEKVLNSVVKSSSNIERIYGIDTTTASRKLIIDCLYIMVRDTPEVFRSEEIINQIKTLINNKGKIEHMVGEHDDCVMAKSFAGYITTHFAHVYRRFRVTLNDDRIKSFKKVAIMNDQRFLDFKERLDPLKEYRLENRYLTEERVNGDYMIRVRGRDQKERNFSLVSSMNNIKVRLIPRPLREPENVDLMTYMNKEGNNVK